MGPAVEIFLLFVAGLAVVIGGLLYFTRPLWKRAASTIVEADRRECELLEQRARERAEEAERRRRAEEELRRCLAGEEVGIKAGAPAQSVPQQKTGETCENSPKTPQDLQSRP